MVLPSVHFKIVLGLAAILHRSPHLER